MKKYLITFAAAALALAACNKSVDPALTVSPTSLSFEAQGGTLNFNITSNTSWTVNTDGQEWYSLDVTSGENDAVVSVTVAAYTEAAGRTAQLTVTGSGLVQTVALAQLRPTPPEEVSKVTLTEQARAHEVTVAVPEGYAYRVEIPDGTAWLTVSAQEDGAFTLHFDENATDAYRAATVRATLTDGTLLAEADVRQSWRNVEPGELLIEEIFFAGNLIEGTSSPTTGEQYFRLTNNAGHTVYADNVLILVESFFDSQQTAVGAYWAIVDADNNEAWPEDRICVETAYAIPGSGTDVPLEAGQSIVIAVTAQDFSKDNAGSFDLSTADFEIYDENDRYPDTDNPDVPNLTSLFKESESLFVMHNRGFESYALASVPSSVGLDGFITGYVYNPDILFFMRGSAYPTTRCELTSRATSAHYVPNEWVLDGVNCGIEENFRRPQFNASIDAGYTGCGTTDGDMTRFGTSARRNRDASGRLVDTDNSTNDFTRSAVPTLKK